MDGFFVGIDIGTANSCFAYTKGDSNTNILSIDNNDKLPSVITFSDKGIYVGNDALSNFHDLWSTTAYFKTIIGENIIRTFNGVSYNPSELSGILIRKLLKEFKNKTGAELKKAVLTIPSDYGDLEKHSIYNAARIGGLDEVCLLSETLAAAITYGEEKHLTEGNIIVYDFGAGTFDVAVINIKNGVYKVLADESNRDLGSRELDMEIATLLFTKIVKNSGRKASDPAFDSEFRRTLMFHAYKVKLDIEHDDTFSGSITVGGQNVEYTITKSEIEMEIYILLLKTIEIVGIALRNSKLSMEDIDKIVLVGGPSTMCMVWDMLKKSYPSAELDVHDPNYAISKGAAIYAESYFGEKEKIKAIPVITKTYGILGGIDNVEMVCNMIYKNSQIPAHSKLSCRPKRDDQTNLRLEMYESSARRDEPYIEASECKLLKVFNIPLTGRISRGRTKISVTADTDKNGKVTIVVECNGVKTPVSFIDEINLTEEEIAKAREKTERVI